ncbi:MAG: hypothetical protein JNM26_07330 [Ideonella sp.]|nr:hypothetical protein [Ideonella sp.]
MRSIRRTKDQERQGAAPWPDFVETTPLGPATEAVGSPETSPQNSRLEVCPPSLFGDDDLPTRSRFGTWWPTTLNGLRGWLATGWLPSSQGESSPAAATDPLGESGDVSRVRAARLAFDAALHDIPGAAAQDLAHRAREAVTLRELWHLRNELFTLVSIHHCESVGHARVASLNRFFPVRSQGAAPRRAWPFTVSARHASAARPDR